ncbi:hypothetical protein CEUSTIGMA_g11186.t1 [Chlamydomonas eustigma]|uniref:Uncharacterized protein n=1 Tax=Chlamydomonas eustigma TaxID=1157962 RepID=A0A250XKY4_9CHLO|nr:hypothetical protein CEUSTIGMA_g11186.t1 [Chlamydomonas eustigma]|eukprot:GAX83761.1 hypothetical protein CEUSTIGMA_g11186.t1 [Chlamydomonas eustigma]
MSKPEARDSNVEDIFAAEVIEALELSMNGKSAGPDGISMEFLKNAYSVCVDLSTGADEFKQYVMVQELVYLFNKVLECGYDPEDWATAALVPVPKP